jgi:hypothetical protein
VPNKKPSWSSALISGRATLGGASSIRAAFVCTAGFLIVTGTLWIALKLFDIL